MAGGLGAERTFGLPAYAERFAERGYAAFAFDYRNAGDSEGEPRNLVSPSRQVNDLRAAINGMRGLDGVDGGRLALWGFDLGGGHVVSAAANDPRIGAVVGVMPVTDGQAAMKSRSLGYRAKALAAGVRDRVQSLALGPYEIPVVGDSEEFAVFNQPGAETGFLDLVPPDSPWKNATPARVALALRGYRPVDDAPDVTCPTLLLGGARDEIVSASTVEDAADELPEATFVRLPSGHFDVFAGEAFERALAHQIAFLDTTL